MEIKGPNPNSYPSNHTHINRNEYQLQNGQILKAIVANINNNKILFDIIEPKLSIKLEAGGNTGFKQGQTVSLQVIATGPPPILNVLGNTNATSPAQNTINSALRLVIPKQTSMNQLLSNLQFLSNPTSKLNETYPQEILDLSRAVFQRLSGINDIKTAAGVKLAINASGIFLEHQLQAALTNKGEFSINDTRTALLKLAESIRSKITDSSIPGSKFDLSSEKKISPPVLKNNNQFTRDKYGNSHQVNSRVLNSNDLNRIPSNLNSIKNTNSALNELLRNIENSLAKIQYHQLQHFFSDDQLKTNWFFDLPVRREDGSDIFHFKFTKEDTSSNDKKTNEWSVTLTFNLEKLGNISIQIYLRNDKIGATVWAKKNETYHLFKQHLSSLQVQMEQSGINISNICCNNGEIIQRESTISKNLLDEKV